MFNQRAGTLSAEAGGDCLALAVEQARTRPVAHILLGLLLAQALAACGGSGSGGGSDADTGSVAPPVATTPVVATPPPSAAPPTVATTPGVAAPPLSAAPPSESPPSAMPPTVPPARGMSRHGRFVGKVTIGETAYFGDALLTVDGAIRLYVGGPYAPSGVIQGRTPEGSAQVVGTVEVHGDQVSGTGVVIGQGCSGPQVVRFCKGPSSGVISLAASYRDIDGTIQVTTQDGDETWLLELTSWDNYYVLPARLDYLTGQYREELAEFAPDGDVVMSVDGAGRIFFQSAHSACTGNGTLAPHRDGVFNVYDVTLTIDNCGGPYAYLNGEYEGLGTTSPGAYWDYDSSLRIWLSKRAGGPSQPAALVMWGRSL